MFFYFIATNKHASIYLRVVMTGKIVFISPAQKKVSNNFITLSLYCMTMPACCDGSFVLSLIYNY